MPTGAHSHPIRTLGGHITTLEAAIALTLADPERDAVHRLRTSTRRVEAQIELLRLLPTLPTHDRSSRHILKQLKRLRRAAGVVRDLDVQRKLVHDQKIELEQQTSSHAVKELRRQSRDLRRSLKHQRAPASKSLVDLIKKEQRDLVPALENLLRILRPAEALSLSPAKLSQLTLRWYRQHVGAPRATGTDNLHNVRKFAKLARYIAEAGAAKLANSFESIQQAGGTWHDLATLADIAERELGRHSTLTRALIVSRDTSLERYQQTLLQQQPSRSTTRVKQLSVG